MSKEMKTQIPLYRAKKIDSDEWVIGYLAPISSTDDLYIYTIEYTNESEIMAITYKYHAKVDSTTLSIHFPDMKDSEGNKIFFEYVEEEDEIHSDSISNVGESCDCALDDKRRDVNPHSPENFGFEKPEWWNIDINVEIYFKDRLGCLHGRDIENNECIRWTDRGVCCTHTSEYNLTPKKKNWWECEENIGKLIYDTVDKMVVIIDWLDKKGNIKKHSDPTLYRHERFRPATKQEILSLIVEE